MYFYANDLCASIYMLHVFSFIVYKSSIIITWGSVHYSGRCTHAAVSHHQVYLKTSLPSLDDTSSLIVDLDQKRS